MLWLDKYEPEQLDVLQIQPAAVETFRRFAANKDIPHLILHGPSGAGKATLVRCLLRELFGPGVFKTRLDTLHLPDSSTEFRIRGSAFHQELYAADLGFKDRQCVLAVIKQVAQQPGAGAFARQTSLAPKFRVFVVQEAHFLSLGAQASLRRTLEKHTGNTRVIMLCEQLSRVIGPLRSRCYCMRIPAVPQTETVAVLRSVLESEGVKMPASYLQEIHQASGGNLRAALLLLQKAHKQVHKEPPLRALQPEWKKMIAEDVVKMRKQPTTQTALDIREELSAILVQGLDGPTVLRHLAEQLLVMQELHENCKLQVIRSAAHYAHAMAQGSGTKDSFHLEAFVSSVLVSLAESR